MQSALGIMLLALANSRSLTNVGQVLKHNRCAQRSVLYYLLREDVIRVPVESLLLLRQLFQVFLRRFCSFGLELSSYAEVATVNLFPVRGPKKLRLRGNSGAIKSQVYPHDKRTFLDNRLRHINYHVQPECALTGKQVCCGDPMTCILRTEMRHAKGDSQPTSTASEIDGLSLPVERVGMDIVTDWTAFTLGTLHRFELWNSLATLLGTSLLLLVVSLVSLLPGKDTLECFSGFDTRLNEQVTYQARTSNFGLVVRRMMQLDAVLFALLPTIAAHHIKGVRKLLKRFLQGLCLFRSWMQVYSHGSIHAETIPYMCNFCQMMSMNTERGRQFLP